MTSSKCDKSDMDTKHFARMNMIILNVSRDILWQMMTLENLHKSGDHVYGVLLAGNHVEYLHGNLNVAVKIMKSSQSFSKEMKKLSWSMFPLVLEIRMEDWVVMAPKEPDKEIQMINYLKKAFKNISLSITDALKDNRMNPVGYIIQNSLFCFIRPGSKQSGQYLESKEEIINSSTEWLKKIPDWMLHVDQVLVFLDCCHAAQYNFEKIKEVSHVGIFHLSSCIKDEISLYDDLVLKGSYCTQCQVVQYDKFVEMIDIQLIKHFKYCNNENSESCSRSHCEDFCLSCLNCQSVDLSGAKVFITRFYEPVDFEMNWYAINAAEIQMGNYKTAMSCISICCEWFLNDEKYFISSDSRNMSSLNIIKYAEQNHQLQYPAKVLNETQSVRDRITDEKQFVILFERGRTPDGNINITGDEYVMSSQWKIIHQNHNGAHGVVEDRKTELLNHHSLQQDLGQNIVHTTSPRKISPSGVVQRRVTRSELREYSSSGSIKLELPKEIIKLLQENADQLKHNPDKNSQLLLWDISGHQVFCTMHQIFLTHLDMNYMISDAIGQLTDLVDDACCLDSEGMMKCRVRELIERRLKSIHCFPPFSELGISPWTLAGTYVDMISQKQSNGIDSETKTTTSGMLTQTTIPTPTDIVTKEHLKASNILMPVLNISKRRTAKWLPKGESIPVSSMTGHFQLYIPKCICIQRDLSLTCKQRNLDDAIKMTEDHKYSSPTEHRGNYCGPAIVSETDKISHSEEDEAYFHSTLKILPSVREKDLKLSVTDNERFISVHAPPKRDFLHHVSLWCEEKTTSPVVLDFNFSEIDAVDLSLTCKHTNLEDAIKFVKYEDIVHSSVKTFFKTKRGTFDPDGGKTEQQMQYVADDLAPKGKGSAEIDERNVRDINLKRMKKSVLHRTIYPVKQLPLPSLSRDAIVGYIEGHLHAELGEILRLLASDEIPEPHITMRYDMLRICTMKTFPGRDRPFATRITGAGFYYAGHQDQVICYCCGSRKDNWVLEDVPMLIHQTMAPNCCFLTDNAAVNVPVTKANSTSSSSAEVRLLDILISGGSNHSDTAQGGSSLLLPSSEQSRVKVSSGTHQMLVTNKTSAPNQLTLSMGQNVLDNQQTPFAHTDSVEVPPPKYPQYAVKTVRISSFQGWSEELQQKPEEMAECGFYYAGFNDCVRCFYCGVGLRHWMNEDDPWIEHARWSTSCVYVRKMKGEEFVSLVKMAVEIAEREEEAKNNGRANQPPQNNTETAPVNTMKEDFHGNNSTISITARDSGCSRVTTGSAVGGTAASTPPRDNVEIQKYLLTDAAQSVLEMRYQPKMVLQAIEKGLMKKGTQELTGQIIMETLFEIEEQEKPKHQLKPSPQSAQDNENSPKDGEAAIGGAVEGIQIDPEKIRKEHRELREVTLCKICLDNTSSVVFLPCGHLVTCPDCAPAMRKCPICRTLIKGTVKTFFG